MSESSDAGKWRTMLVAGARIIGWIAASAGILVCVLCAILFFDRSPDDFEGTAQFAAVHIAVGYGLPLLIAGGMIAWFAGRARRKAHPDALCEPD